jgi:hypothetical protein
MDYIQSDLRINVLIQNISGVIPSQKYHMKDVRADPSGRAV